MLRRYLVMITPAIAILSVYGIKSLLNLIFSGSRRSSDDELAMHSQGDTFSFIEDRTSRFKLNASGIILILAVGTAAYFLWGNRELRKHKEFEGSFSFMQRLAEKVAANDVLILGAREANDLHIIGPMLSYYFDKNVLLLRETYSDLGKFREFVRSWKGKVYFAGAGNTNLASDQFFLKPVEAIRFETPVYDEVYNRRPRVALSKYFQIGWYKVELAPSGNPYFIDIGKFDDGNITNFYLKESYAGINYRWTDGNGRIFFPPVKSERITSIVLQLNPGPWVPGMEKVHVKIYLNNLYLVDLTLRNGYNSYEVSVPAAISEKISGEPVEVRIESKSWVPKRVLGLPDTRRVGVIVDWVRLNINPIP